ncbi:ABC transporter substrate-binding protein [Rubripirellula amarantea]|nr:extracellular solute-binding protein [Rubripirellula amarantea]
MLNHTARCLALATTLARGSATSAQDKHATDSKPKAKPEPTQGPTILSKKRRVVRVLGTHVTLQEDLRKRAEADLGIELQFSPGGSAEVLHRASTRPESFDLYEQWSNSMRVLWQVGAIQPIETKRLRYWSEINQLTTTGRLTPNAKIGAGDAPNRLLFVQPDGALGGNETSKVSFLPYVHNVDSFGYDAGKIPRGIPYETESWSWLLDEQHQGKVAIVNAPTIGLFDLALAAQAKGLIEFDDIGNISRSKLDELFDILMTYRRRGHFRGIWSSVPASVELMKSGESVVESMFSPAVFDLKAQGVDCVYASPVEGYRAWHGVMCLSVAAQGDVKDAAYEYMNWWLSGWPGAFIAKQGYYISNPQRSRKELTADEWDYWYEGKPARTDLLGTQGKVVVNKGASRDGGSYERRFSNIAVWNTVMPTYEYSLTRWNEFLSG